MLQVTLQHHLSDHPPNLTKLKWNNHKEITVINVKNEETYPPTSSKKMLRMFLYSNQIPELDE